ncbi:YafY family transcriptional regulator [Massilia atriviolacea]|uniref:YafY family transcriptional regulator n=1 Tax=Massilia atriviolacea TaxID=2495579 RepID=A0A430HTB6_9BURK|nr:YafY family protein [Massilia atriviolacea]RSZ60775.1 YafY family transcriptional regulator [Massilia atriviolacea]
MYHPTTRVLAVLELLQTHGRLSGAEMSARLGVDTRTLRRYIVTLDEMGIPITTERGRHGGYALMAGFKLPPMMFTNDEALALAIGLLAARSLGFAEAAPAVASAQAKLERIMPANLKRRVRAIDETVRLDMLRAVAPQDNDALVTLSSAALAQQRVCLRYRTPEGDDSERDFDAYGLAFRGGCWYVIGMCHLRAGMRSFRLDRILKVETRPVSFARPAGFDALGYLTRSMASMPREHPVEIVLHTDLQTASAHFFGALGVLEQIDGGVLLRCSTDHVDWFAGHLAGLPFEFEVRAPALLRASLARLGERLLRTAGALG